MRMRGLPAGLLEGLIHLLGRARRRSGPEHLATGRDGELAAFFYLKRQGFIVVARDWTSGQARGDIDLVAWEGDTLCFVEVKTRSTRTFATAEAAVDEDKRFTLRRLARHYLRQLPEGTLSRFDILSVYLDRGAKGQRKATTDFEFSRAAFAWQ